MLVFAVEYGSFPFGYAFALAGSAWDVVALGLLSFALATWMTPCVVAVALGTRWLRVPARRWPRVAMIVPISILLVTGLLVSVSQHGERWTAPAPWEGLVLALPAVTVAALLRWIVARSTDPAEITASALTSTAFAIFYLATFETGMLFVTARFGLTHANEIERTLVVLGVPSAIVLSGALSPAVLRWRPAAGWTLQTLAAAMLGLAVLHHVNAGYFVDLHQPVHTALLWESLHVAWWITGPLLDALPRHRPPGAKAAAALLATTAALVTWLAPGTTAGYLASQHTAQARAGMEALFGIVRQPIETAAFRVRALERFLQDARGRSLPASRLPLPSTFAVPTPDPRLERLEPGSANLVIFFLDTKRDRDIGPDARGKTRTPRIDRCFAGGVRFRRALSNATQTMTVFPSIYASVYAGSHGQMRPDLLERATWLARHDGDQNLVELLKDAGFHARVLTNQYYLQYLRGPKYRHLFGTFDTIVAADESHGQNEGLLEAIELHPELTAPDRRFLLVLHIMSHGLDALPMVDRVVGAVCEELRARGLFERTTVMLTADHGVQFGEHGRTTYGRTLFDEEIHVPLLWRVPGFPPTVANDPVSSLDHLPTIADLFGIPIDFPVEGRSYLGALQGKRLDLDRPLYFEVRRHDIASTGVFRRGFKLIHWHGSDGYALFDLRNDPRETRNLVSDPRHAHELRELSALIAEFRAERGEAH